MSGMRVLHSVYIDEHVDRSLAESSDFNPLRLCFMAWSIALAVRTSVWNQRTDAKVSIDTIEQ